ncbi:MAG TPA: hypothetical protein VKA81_04785 [Verrucomicrobiae bacterium]|nr:hypothetical protein [Verrucomicrobiae bacterium]
MFSFSKRKLKGGEVGLGFFDSVRKARLAGYPEKEELFPQDAEIGQGAVKDEWLYLEIFTVDFVVFLALGKTPEKAAVLTPFGQSSKKWLQPAIAFIEPCGLNFLNSICCCFAKARAERGVQNAERACRKV